MYDTLLGPKIFGINLVYKAVTNPTIVDLPKVDPTEALFKVGMNIFFGVVGVVCMLIIVIQGFKMTISRGNPQDFAKARNGVVYAVAGLFITAMATAIANFIVRQVM